ncbi:uncharacterized protein [Manis javanica]|uniref:uncharacterized protein n=1 Tax=Manis javanica TaxID=9974 RepID=UPI003C6CE933
MGRVLIELKPPDRRQHRIAGSKVPCILKEAVLPGVLKEEDAIKEKDKLLREAQAEVAREHQLQSIELKECQEQFAFTWEGWQWTFTILPQGYLHSPTICHGLVAQDLATWEKLPTVRLYHYIDDVTFTSNSLSDLEGAAPRLLQHLQEKGWAMNSAKVQGPGLSVKFLGVVWSGKTKVIPEAVIGKSRPSYFHNCNIAAGISGSSRLLESVYTALGANSEALIPVGTKGHQVGLG